MNNVLKVFLVICAVAAVGCDWASNAHHIQCPLTETVDTNLESLVAQDVTVQFCSKDVAFQPAPQTVPGHSERKPFSSSVRQTTRDYVAPYADGCGNQGHVGESQSVGKQIPLMTQADLVNFKFCYNSAALFTSDNTPRELYTIIPRASACPAGSSDFDQTSVACK
jgi:hypothetical protein